MSENTSWNTVNSKVRICEPCKPCTFIEMTFDISLLAFYVLMHLDFVESISQNTAKVRILKNFADFVHILK